MGGDEEGEEESVYNNDPNIDCGDRARPPLKLIYRFFFLSLRRIVFLSISLMTSIFNPPKVSLL